MKTQIRRRIHVMLAVVASVALAWILLGQQSAMTAAQTNFVGGSPSRPDSSDMRAIRLRFEAGSRSNWHSHSNWQILMAEEGRGRTQIRGEEIVELVPGRPVHAGANVVHWHGAAPDEDLVMLSIRGDGVEWHESVSDDVYLQEPIR